MEDVRESQTKIIEKLSSNEEIIRNLYLEYAAAFPQHQGFWDELANEERIHSNVIKSWLKYINSGELTWDDSRFDEVMIDSVSVIVGNYAKEIKDGFCTLERAANVTVGLEESLLENKFFEEWQGDSPALKQSLAFMRDDCANHLKKAKEFRSSLNN